ncbi:MAG: hypothetical protein AB7N76_01055 [Planctomycetota bacterium]
MTGDQIEQLIAKSEQEPAFLERLIAQPRTAAAEVGVTLEDEEVETFAAMTVEDLEDFAAEYRAAADPDRRRAAC